MTARQLEGRAVLLIEDEYFQAMEVKVWLEGAGAEVIGPSGDYREISALIQDRRIDMAVIDINLGAGIDFGLARQLRQNAIPFVFLTGYDCAVVPADLADALCLSKPADARRVLRAIGELDRVA